MIVMFFLSPAPNIFLPKVPNMAVEGLFRPYERLFLPMQGGDYPPKYVREMRFYKAVPALPVTEKAGTTSSGYVQHQGISPLQSNTRLIPSATGIYCKCTVSMRSSMYCAILSKSRFSVSNEISTPL